MTSGKRQRGPSPTQRQAAARQAAAAAAAAKAARRKRLIAILVPLVVVCVAVGVVVGVRHVGTGGGAPNPPSAQADMIGKVTGVSSEMLDAVGVGTTRNNMAAASGTPVTGPDGKPRVVYMGVEWCPYCAAVRWPLVVALSRFGTFANLGQTTSAPSPEIYPNTASLSFHGATYTSAYINFTGTEIQDRNHNPLDPLSPADQALYNQYNGDSAIPLVVFSNEYVASGLDFDPTVLQGQSQDQIAAALADPNSPTAKAILGSANVFTAAICHLTGDQPSSVCQSPGVRTGAAQLPAVSH